MDTVTTTPAKRPASPVSDWNGLPVYLLSPAMHAALVLPTGTHGITTIGWHAPYVNDKGETDWRWCQAGADATEVMDAVYRHEPRFISMSAFTKRPRRGRTDYHTDPDKRLGNLSTYGALWVDLDTYNKPSWASASETGVVFEILDRLNRAGSTALGIPLPSYIVRSGAGYHVVWLTDRVPPKASAAWNALQTLLNDLFIDMGRDTAAMPASANLRLVGTRHENETVRIAWPELVGQIERHEFRSLCRAAFTYTPEQVATYKAEKVAAKTARKAAAASRIRSGQSPVLTGKTYWATLRKDVEAVFDARYPVVVAKGDRNAWLVTLAKVWAWCMPAAALRARVEAYAPRLGLSVSKAVTQAGSIIRRAEAQDRSERPLGKAGRYPVGPRKLAIELGVTQKEARMLDLRVMIPASMKAARVAERQEKSRRAKGAVARSETQDARLALGIKALALRAEGLSLPAIQERLGVKPTLLAKAIREAKAVTVATSPKVSKVIVEPSVETIVDADTTSRGSSRCIADDVAEPSCLAVGEPESYSHPVHDEAATRPDKRPVKSQRLGGSFHVAIQEGRTLPAPAFVAAIRKPVPA